MSSLPSTLKAHPVLALLARYRDVFKTAWAARSELAGPSRLATERAFLPAALSLQETPVHPAPRRAAWAIVAFFACSLAWAVIGELDVVAIASGRIVVSERTKVIQPLEPAVVRAIRVKDGDRVKAGQLLVELDPTGVHADMASQQVQRNASESEAQRSEVLLQALSSGSTPRLTTASAESQGLLSAEWQDIEARRARLSTELAHREAELATARAQLDKLQTMLPLARQREADFKSLTDQGFVTNHAGQDRTRERIELERDLATQQARIKEGEAALAESINARTAYLAETRRSLSDRAAQARVKATQLTEEGTKSAQRERQTRLTAPVSGTVQQLAVHTAGGVVTAAQTLMVIVPDGADVTADVVVDNKDIGFIKAGQHAEIKLETFNFTRYGTVPAEVLSVSADAVADEKRGAIFPATLRLDQRQIRIDGKSVNLGPGMNVTAEIKIGRRRVIDYLLSPLKQVASESLKER